MQEPNSSDLMLMLETFQQECFFPVLLAQMLAIIKDGVDVNDT